MLLTGGQAAEVNQAAALLEGHAAEAVLADKAFDSDAFVALVRNSGARVVIPPKSNRKNKRPLDKEAYKQRNQIERFFNRLKHYRRIATRYDKTDTCFLAFIYLAAAIINAN